ncbi:hypothetical protein PLESTF_000545600, partial [Pleodorina starrii]
MEPSEILIHASAVNARFRTHDGFDKCGERLAAEIRQLVQRQPQLKRISVIGHSMGGMIARYALGLLFDPSDCSIAGLAPTHYVTLATPHLGLTVDEGPARVPFVAWAGHIPLLGRGVQRALQAVAHSVARTWFRGTGRHFLALDGGPGELPLLMLMAMDAPDRGQYFFSALAAFASRACYGNVGRDHWVSWENSTIRATEDLPSISPDVVQHGRGVVREDPPEAGLSPGLLPPKPSTRAGPPPPPLSPYPSPPSGSGGPAAAAPAPTSAAAAPTAAATDKGSRAATEAAAPVMSALPAGAATASFDAVAPSAAAACPSPGEPLEAEVKVGVGSRPVCSCCVSDAGRHTAGCGSPPAAGDRVAGPSGGGAAAAAAFRGGGATAAEAVALERAAERAVESPQQVVCFALERLRLLRWRRVDVSFGGARIGTAHNNIQGTQPIRSGAGPVSGLLQDASAAVRAEVLVSASYTYAARGLHRATRWTNRVGFSVLEHLRTHLQAVDQLLAAEEAGGKGK